VKFMTGLYKAFVDTDCSLAEINPLVLTEDGDIVALDAKMNFDATACSGTRHRGDAGPGRGGPDRNRGVPGSASPTSASTATSAAWSNGAGLAMATMDMIKHCGGARRTSSTWAAARPPSR